MKKSKMADISALVVLAAMAAPLPAPSGGGSMKT